MPHLLLEHLFLLSQFYRQMLWFCCLLILVFIKVSGTSYLPQGSVQQRLASPIREIQEQNVGLGILLAQYCWQDGAHQSCGQQPPLILTLYSYSSCWHPQKDGGLHSSIFWTGGKKNEKKIPLVNWETVSKPLMEG